MFDIGEVLIRPLSDRGDRFILTRTSQLPPPRLREIQQHEAYLPQTKRKHTSLHSHKTSFGLYLLLECAILYACWDEGAHFYSKTDLLNLLHSTV